MRIDFFFSKVFILFRRNKLVKVEIFMLIKLGYSVSLLIFRFFCSYGCFYIVVFCKLIFLLGRKGLFREELY